MTIQNAAIVVAPADDRARLAAVDDTERATAALFRRMAEESLSGAERLRVRARIIELNLPLATRLACRYLNRGQTADDLQQVAALGLVKAVDGFDPARGTPFFGYLVPTVAGELKRHFRDHGWDVHVPRRLQERYLAVTHTRSVLTQRLRRVPSVAEIGAELGLATHDVVEALDAGAVYDVGSLHAKVSGEHDAAERQDFVGAEDDALVSLCDKLALRDLLRGLPDRDQRIISMYFFGDMTQDRIAAELGMSQMNVSRLLRRILDRLRHGLDGRTDMPAQQSSAGTAVSVIETRQAVVVTVRGEMDAASVRRTLVDAVVGARRGRVVVDLRQAGVTGAVAARSLVDAYRASGTSGARIAAVNVPPPLYEILCRLGVARMVPCQPLGMPHDRPQPAVPGDRAGSDRADSGYAEMPFAGTPSGADAKLRRTEVPVGVRADPGPRRRATAAVQRPVRDKMAAGPPMRWSMRPTTRIPAGRPSRVPVARWQREGRTGPASGARPGSGKARGP